MSHLERNLASLAARWPRLAGELAGTAPAGDVELLDAHTGAPTARYGGRLLHSTFDPAREAERIAAGSCGGAATSAIVLGFGLGYAVEALLRLKPGLPVLAVEPDPRLFVRALSSRPMEALLGDPRLELFVSADPELLVSLLEPEAGAQRIALGSPCLVPLRPVEDRHKAYFARVQHILVAARDRGRVNVDTLERFGPLWVRNLLRNLETFLASPGVGRIAGLFDGIPALVLASGPSLDQVMPHIRELAERCVVICVDTSLRACLMRRVEPDFVVVIDPQYWNSRHLDGADSPRTLVVAESATHPRALRLAPPRVFFMSSLFPLGRFLESFASQKGELGAGGSVATTAWDFARVAGAHPIVMAGLDLGYPGRATHFRGAFFEQRFLALTRRMEPAEHHAFAYLTGAGPFPVRSNSGDPVLTDRRMAIYASWFEAQARRFPEVGTLSLSPGGVAVSGIGPATVDQILAMPPRRQEIDKRMARAAESAGAQQPPAWSALRDSLARLGADLRRAREVAREAISAADRAAARSGKDLVALAELERHDRHMLALGARDILSFLMQPIIHKVTQERGGVIDPLARTREIYVQVERSAALHERLVSETLARLASKESGSS